MCGPIVLYFIFLEVFLALGMFDDELASGITKAELSRGWGVVTATDIVLAWLIGTHACGVWLCAQPAGLEPSFSLP